MIATIISKKAWLPTVALALLLSACGATSAVLWAVDSPPEEDGGTRYRPESTPTHEFHVEPGTLVPLQLQCQYHSRWPKVVWREDYRTWSLGWRLIGGFLGLGEGLGGGVAIAGGLRQKSTGEVVFGSIAAADALLIWTMILAKDSAWRKRVERGPQEITTPRCPEGVRVRWQNTELTVYENGRLAPADQQWLTDAMLGEPGVLQLLRPDGSATELQLSPAQRCEIAMRLARPAAAWACQQPGQLPPMP